ncbi:MAG: SDR family oxidoreductase [Planctomycetes bacterium]|nr:SDR family oxidoreductase [Planctomycetota bacterium]
MKFEGKVAIITGASRGIGKALALRLASEGAAVVVAAKTAEPHPTLPGTIHDVVREIVAIGGRAIAVQVDVRDEQQIENMVSETLRAFGRVDIMLNNAGALFLEPVENTPAKKFDLVMGVNARAAFLCSRACIKPMREVGGGHIIMMSPPMSDKGVGKTAYALSKFGMTFIAQSLAEEVRADNISVNALWPVTAVDSQATRTFWPGMESEMRTPDVLVDATVCILQKSASELTGQALYDEDVLRANGMTDFSKYSLVPGSSPSAFSKDLMK